MCDVLDHLAHFPKSCGSQIPFAVLPQICCEGITSTEVQKVKELRVAVNREKLKWIQE